jgi:hypothetical protein
LTISGGVFAQTVDQILQADQRRLNLAQQSSTVLLKVLVPSKTSTGL